MRSFLCGIFLGNVFICVGAVRECGGGGERPKQFPFFFFPREKEREASWQLTNRFEYGPIYLSVGEYRSQPTFCAVELGEEEEEDGTLSLHPFRMRLRNGRAALFPKSVLGTRRRRFRRVKEKKVLGVTLVNG